MKPPRITFKHLKDEILSMWNLEQGIPHTTLSILQKPKETIDSYLFEDRRAFIHPLRYVFVASAVSFFISLKSKSHITLTEMVNNSNQAKMGDRPGLAEMMEKSMDMFSSSMQIVLFLSLPVVALITFLLLNKRGFNFWEHIAINAFVFGTVTWVSTIFTIPFMLVDSIWPALLAMALIMVLFTYYYKKIFNHNWVRTIIGYLLAYGFGYMLVSTLVVLAIMIFVSFTMVKAGTLG